MNEEIEFNEGVFTELLRRKTMPNWAVSVVAIVFFSLGYVWHGIMFK